MKYKILNGLTKEYIAKLENRFLDKVNKNGPKVKGMDSKCWIWESVTIRQGYGKIGILSSYQLAHRVSYEMYKGGVGSMHVLHKCDNPPCVNPDHLFLGTDADNTQDKYRKGRDVAAIGVKNGNAKLSPNAVRDIRQNYKPGERGKGRQKYSIGYFAHKYDVSKPTVIRVLKDRGWLHI